MSERPDLGKTLGSLGCALFLLPFGVVLALVAVAIITGGHVGLGLFVILIAFLVWMAVRHGREPARFRRRPRP